MDQWKQSGRNDSLIGRNETSYPFWPSDQVIPEPDRPVKLGYIVAHPFSATASSSCNKLPGAPPISSKTITLIALCVPFGQGQYSSPSLNILTEAAKTSKSTPTSNLVP